MLQVLIILLDRQEFFVFNECEFSLIGREVVFGGEVEWLNTRLK